MATLKTNGRAMGEREPSDEELMGRLVSGREDALGLLHARYALLIFNLASLSLGRASAEEVVQDVFVAIWRKAGTFDPSRGTFRAWALRIAHLRVINELRRRARRPRIEADPNGDHLGTVPELGPDPGEVAWLDDRRALVRAAVEALPPPQRQALSLAFLEDLTHQEISETLNLPLGTTKSRIRAGLQSLRSHRSIQIAAGLVVVALLATALIRDRMMHSAIEQHQAALRLVTSSDVVPLRLGNTPGTPAEMHGNYRGRPGVPMAVMTFSKFPKAPEGRVYRAWGSFGGPWYLLGDVKPDAQGSDLLLIEGEHWKTPPSALEVSLEPVGPRKSASEPPLIVWPKP
jgi:RNA polymerase sigma-70 factor, ECF subfamily